MSFDEVLSEHPYESDSWAPWEGCEHTPCELTFANGNTMFGVTVEQTRGNWLQLGDGRWYRYSWIVGFEAEKKP